MKIQSNERFVRWQTVLRDHLTFLNNLMTAVAIAITGGLIGLLNETTFQPKGCEKLFFSTGLFLTCLSILIGFVVALNRLNDFRLTVNKIKSEIDNQDSNDLRETKELMSLISSLTWKFFNWQIYILAIGCVSLLIAFCLIFSNKLF